MNKSNQSIAEFNDHEQEHANLENLLAKWGEVVAERRASRRDVLELLVGLLENLQSHFDHEEEEQGFFKTVVKQSPRLSEQAEVLIKEHCDLREMLKQTHLHVREDSPQDDWWITHADKYQQFRRRFLCHEQSENELLQQAFTQDIGSND